MRTSSASKTAPNTRTTEKARGHIISFREIRNEFVKFLFRSYQHAHHIFATSHSLFFFPDISRWVCQDSRQRRRICFSELLRISAVVVVHCQSLPAECFLFVMTTHISQTICPTSSHSVFDQTKAFASRPLSLSSEHSDIRMWVRRFDKEFRTFCTVTNVYVDEMIAEYVGDREEAAQLCTNYIYPPIYWINWANGQRRQS